ncbi:unnamed protein product [Effrenium voratum]|nr:unnamed protein product [Effrenium voratum]
MDGGTKAQEAPRAAREGPALLMTSASIAMRSSPGQGDAFRLGHLAGKLSLDPSARYGGSQSWEPEGIRADRGSRTSTAESNASHVSPSSTTSSLDAALEELEELEASIEAVSDEVYKWRPDRFQMQRTLQMAARNQGAVNLMKCLEDGQFVAVKTMPCSWTTNGHRQHRRAHPRDTENPWVDFGIVRYLAKKSVPWVCEPMGIFMDSEWTYCVSSLATEGDFFNFVSIGPEPGPAREKALQPFMVQVFSAVRWLHDRFIAHCDISMENILVSRERGQYQVKLIDFSMAVMGQKVTCGHRGKPSYQAPEMALSPFYDPFALDCFALGVVIFSSTARVYPWLSTVQGSCKCFDYVVQHGHRKFWRTRKIKKTVPVQTIDTVLSEELKQIIEGMLALNACDRLSIEEVFNFGWFHGDGAVSLTAFGSDQKASFQP